MLKSTMRYLLYFCLALILFPTPHNALCKELFMKENKIISNRQPDAMTYGIQLDDFWRTTSQFLDFPSLANLKRVSKRFYTLVNAILEQEKDPEVLRCRITELDAIALKKLGPIIFDIEEYKKRFNELNKQLK